MDRIRLEEALLPYAREVETQAEEGEDFVTKVFSYLTHKAEPEARRELVGFVRRLESEGCTKTLDVLKAHGLLGITAEDVIEVEPYTDFSETFRDNTLEIIKKGAPLVKVKWPRA